MTFEGNLKHFSSFCCPCPSFQQLFVVFILPDRLWYWTIGLKSVVWEYRKFNIFYMWAYLLVQIQMCVYCTASVDHDSLLAYFNKVHFFRVSFSKCLYGFYAAELRIILMYGIIINTHLILWKYFSKICACHALGLF